VACTEPALETRILQPNIGAEIVADASSMLSGEHATRIRALLEERGVLVFRSVHLDDDQQVAFTGTLGTFAHDNNGVADANGERTTIYKVSLDPDINPQAAYLQASFFWHLDGTMHEVPILASVLGARHLPSEGAVTEFANTYAAYDALPEADKEAIEGLRVVHANWALLRSLEAEPTYERFTAARKVPTKTQPLVWKHRSGRRSLVIGATAAYVEDLDPTDSMDVLVKLRDWATRPEFVYHHEWREGDLVMWDNTGTLHRARPYDPMSGRLLHRTMLQGEEPIA
jgi:alpha-ketoglutarate-dependent taurine dioxygenase